MELISGTAAGEVAKMLILIPRRRCGAMAYGVVALQFILTGISFGADIIGTKKYMFMAVLNADETVVVATQDNSKLLLQLDFDRSGASVTGASGYSLGTAFSVDSVAPELGPDEVYLVLDSVNPADIAGGAVGTVDLSIADAGGPMPFTVDVAFRKLSTRSLTVFDGYVTSTPPTTPGDVQIEPASIKHAPPIGWGTAFGWSASSPAGLPLGLTIDIVPDAGAAKVEAYVAAYGGAWAAQDGTFELSVASASAAWENSCSFGADLSLRVLSDLTLFENEILPKAETALSGAAAEGSYVFGAAVVTGAATLSIDDAGFVTAFTVTGFPQDQTADIPITDGTRPTCTPRLDLNFRTRGSSGYTILEGHLDGEDNIVGPSAEVYSVGVEGVPAMSGGGTVTLDFDVNAAINVGPSHTGGTDTWNDDGNFVMTIQDGLRPTSRLNTNLSLRRFPAAGMSYFEQQDNAAAEPALGLAADGTYQIIAVESADSDVPLVGSAPRPLFNTNAALIDFLNPVYPAGSNIVNMRVTDGGRPYSVTALSVDQRWIADNSDAHAAGLNIVDPDADFVLRIRNSQPWDWQSPSIPGLSSGSVAFSGATTAVDEATFDLSGADGNGSLRFELARIGHPAVRIDIPLTVGGTAGIPVTSEWGWIVLALVMLVVGSIVYRPEKPRKAS